MCLTNNSSDYQEGKRFDCKKVMRLQILCQYFWHLTWKSNSCIHCYRPTNHLGGRGNYQPEFSKFNIHFELWILTKVNPTLNHSKTKRDTFCTNSHLLPAYQPLLLLLQANLTPLGPTPGRHRDLGTRGFIPTHSHPSFVSILFLKEVSNLLWSESYSLGLLLSFENFGTVSSSVKWA